MFEHEKFRFISEFIIGRSVRVRRAASFGLGFAGSTWRKYFPSDVIRIVPEYRCATYQEAKQKIESVLAAERCHSNILADLFGRL